MNCAEIRDAFRAGKLPESAELRAHLQGCPTCSELFSEQAQLGQSLGRMPCAQFEVPDSIWEQVEHDLRNEGGIGEWLRSRRSAVRVAMGLASVSLLVIVIAARPRHDQYPALHLTALSMLFAAGIFVGVAETLAPLSRPLSSKRTQALALALLLTPASYAVASQWLHHEAAGSVPLIHSAWSCFRSGVVIALLAFLLLRWLDRASPVAASRRQLVLALAAAGLVGNLALLLHCSVADPAHILLGHASLGIAMAACALGIRRLRTP